MVYKTPTNEIHKTIQVGTKMISQGQLIILEKNKYVLNAMVPRVLSPNLKKRGKCPSQKVTYNIVMEILTFWSDLILFLCYIKKIAG